MSLRRPLNKEPISDAALWLGLAVFALFLVLGAVMAEAMLVWSVLL